MQHVSSPHHTGHQVPLPHLLPCQGHRSPSYTGAAAGSIRRKTSGNATSNPVGYGAPPPTPVRQVPSGGPGPTPFSPGHAHNSSPLPSFIHLNLNLNLAGKDHFEGPPSPNPWEQMGHTYTWVVEQEMLRERRHHRHGGHGSMHGAGQSQHPSGDHFKPSAMGKIHGHGKKPHIEEWVIQQQVYHSYSPSSSDDSHHQAKRSPHSRRYTTSGAGGVYAPDRRDRERGQEHGPGSMPLPHRGKTFDEVIYSYEMDADRWMRHEQAARERRIAEERLRTNAKLRVQEELRRIDERIQQRRAEEKRILQESRPRIWASTKAMYLREKEKRKPKNIMVSVTESWDRYEEGWKTLSNTGTAQASGSTEASDDAHQATPGALSFGDIPWPLTVPPSGVEDITPEVVAGFLLSPAHSRAIGVKERLRSAQLRWHPDRFRRLLPRVDESDRAAVEEGAGIVARCLNELMEREKGRQNSSDSFGR